MEHSEESQGSWRYLNEGRGRNGKAWVSIECIVKYNTSEGYIIWPVHTPDDEYTVWRAACNRTKCSNEPKVLQVREWYVKRKMMMTKQKRGTFAASQSGSRDYVVLSGDIIGASEKAILFVSKEDPES